MAGEMAADAIQRGRGGLARTWVYVYYDDVLWFLCTENRCRGFCPQRNNTSGNQQKHRSELPDHTGITRPKTSGTRQRIAQYQSRRCSRRSYDLAIEERSEG